METGMLPPGLHYEHRQHTGRKEAFCLTSFATFSDQTARSMLIFRREKKKKKTDQDLFTKIDKMLHYFKIKEKLRKKFIPKGTRRAC